MTIKFGNTAALDQGITFQVVGPPGVGKTTLIKTLPAPLIITPENGLLSLRHDNIPFIEVENYKDFNDAISFALDSADAASFQSIAIDALTAICRNCLTEALQKNKDGRKAYGEYAEEVMADMKRLLLYKGKHVYVNCEQSRLVDEATGQTQYGTAMPGNQLTQYMKYWGDELFAMRMVPNAAGQPVRALQTQPDMQYYAKDRSGALDFYEQPNLGNVIQKIYPGT